MVRALAVDVGSSSVRTAVVDELGTVGHVHRAALSVTTPSPGEVELDPREIARLALELATRTIDDAGGVDVVGVTNQRATTVVFEAATGEPVGPALSWQDLRTVIDCLVLQGEGVFLAPNQSATKARWLVGHSERPASALRVATLESWIAWHLSEGSSYVADRSNASVTGLVRADLSDWDHEILAHLGLEGVGMPRLVDTMEDVGRASALPGSPRLCALVGDQSASLFGQSCVTSGTKITFGTGAMLDAVDPGPGPRAMRRLPSGCYPTVVRSSAGHVTWGIEGIVLSAGSCVEWLVDLGLLESTNDSNAIAASVPTSEGVAFVPAFSGLGTPEWDFGARGAFFGLSRGSSRAHLVRSVLEGVAQRGIDLVESAEGASGAAIEELRVDGGMSDNPFFVQHLADLAGRRVAVSSEREATARGAGLMALVGAGLLDLGAVESLWRPAYVAIPRIGEDERAAARSTWRSVIERAKGTIPELSSISF